MPRDTILVGLPTGFRLRRTHDKSRNGCLRCKKQRKKCDELKPSCSRCMKCAYRCQYHGDDNLSVSNSHAPPTSHPSVVVRGPGSPFALSSDHLSVPSPSFSVPSPSASGGQPAVSSDFGTDRERLVLDATELSLLAHYLTHTSQTIPFDDLDLYALSVGVPNLAFNCNAVMSSLLALAAACKSHDIAKQAQTPLDHQNLADIRDLLAVAERHHRASLRHIQASMQTLESGSYDDLLANAALMVLYASASHSIRVYLAATAKQRGQRLPNDLLPQHSQWISFTRAAHIASTAVLNDMVNATTTSPIVDTIPSVPGPGSCSRDVLSPQDGPSENTKRLFLPLVTSTYVRALEGLRNRAESTVALLKRSELAVCNSLELHASLETITVLEKCASAALSTRRENKPNAQSISSNRLSRVSLWVARYMIRVTSMESPQVLRRIIMSFLNQAPAEYLNLVQSVLDSPSAEARAETWMTRDSDSPRTEEPSLSATHLLAMDIFAHWLVLVMLLDGVWWIGDIGQWELGQVVSLMKTQSLPGQSAGTGDTWWPESMYLVKRELTVNI